MSVVVHRLLNKLIRIVDLYSSPSKNTLSHRSGDETGFDLKNKGGITINKIDAEAAATRSGSVKWHIVDQRICEDGAMQTVEKGL